MTYVWGTIEGAHDYERLHTNDIPQDKILIRAAALRNQWAKAGIFHTGNATSIMYVMWNLDLFGK